MAERQDRARKRSLSPDTAVRDHKRIKLSSSDIKEMKRDKIIGYWKDQDNYIESLLAKLENSSAEDVARLRDSECKLQLQVQELTRRENVLNMRLATKQEEMRNLLAQLHDLKQAQEPNSSNLHNMLFDPAVNLVFQRMQTELKDSKEKLDQAQNDLSAWKFTPDSVTGKKLMAKCRSLLQENQDLGKQISHGRVAQLEAEISVLNKYCQELKASNEELCEFILQQDEEGECMIATIMSRHQQTKDTQASKPSSSAASSSSSSSTSARDRTPKSNGPTSTSTSTSNSHKLASNRSQE